MFAPGPAMIATSRFHVGAFQYASGPSASRSSVRPFSADARARRELLLAQRMLEVVERREASDELGRLERPLDAVDRAHEARRLLRGVREPAVGVVRDRAVHSGDRHEPAERDRAEAVLDPVALHLEESGREAHIELPRPQADGQRAEEVARLVDEDEEGEAQDGDEDAHDPVPGS